jgi:hypothetical protein
VKDQNINKTNQFGRFKSKRPEAAVVVVLDGERLRRNVESPETGRHEVPRFRSHNSDPILLPTINHYMGNKCRITMIYVMIALMASVGESKTDLTQSPRLIRER